MGIYIGLEIIPNKINKEDWQKVFEETLQLICSYPFATLITEDIDGYKRIVLDRTEWKYVNGYGRQEKYWKINGDLESKETGESFTLYSNLDRYSNLREERVKEDILLSFAEDDRHGGREVFYSKTQGKPFHIPLLAIAALIESRFPTCACVYGDISREQAQKAVDWANSVLDKPINLPIRVNPEKLLERLQVIEIEEKRLGALYDLCVGANEEVDYIVGKYFQLNAVRSYFVKELKEFESPSQLGAVLIIIKFLNVGLPLEVLVEICCFDNNGPQFEQVDFVKGICSSWVFIEPEIRGFMELTDMPESVGEQFGSIFLDMRFMGRRTRRYIPKDEVIKVLKGKLGDNNSIKEIIELKYKDTVKVLEEEKKIRDESHAKTKENVIYTLEQLMFWNEKYEISEFIFNGITTIRKAVDESIATRSNLMQILGEAEEQGQLIKVLSQIIQDHKSLILTREAWKWIENENNDVVKRMIMMLGLPVKGKGEVRKLYRAMFENKALFDKFMK